MSTSQELSEQLSLTKELNGVVSKMEASLRNIDKSYSSQLNTLEKLNIVIDQVKTDQATTGLTAVTDKLDELVDKMGQIGPASSDSMSKMVQEVSSADTESRALTSTLTALGVSAIGVGKGSGGFKTLGRSIMDVTKKGGLMKLGLGKVDGLLRNKWVKGATIATAGLSGLVQGFKNTLGMSKSILSFFANLATSAVQVGLSILTIPLKIFEGLIDMAANFSGGMTELMQAIQDVKKEFGALRQPMASSVMTMYKELGKANETGLSSWRVYGMLHERLNKIREVATAMGAVWDVQSQNIMKHGRAIFDYMKGLGLSDDQMRIVGQRATTMGTDIEKSFRDVTKYTYAMRDSFGISAKVLSKDMAKAMEDVGHFAHLTIKEIAKAATYTRKLGIELDKVVGTLDAFETFEGAAENVAKLSQTFGVTIDAFKMMDAQDPAEQIDILRKSFRDAGVDVTKFDRASTKLLATTTGLDAAAVRQAFSMKNQGLSLEEIKKKSDSAEKSTLSQADAMRKIAKSIELFVRPAQKQMGGFWKMFIEGFTKGVQWSKEFRRVMRNIKRGLWVVYRQGIQLGRAFVKMFPGVKKFLGAIAEFFEPSKFGKFFGGVKKVMKEAFQDLTEGKFSFKKMYESMQKHFFNFFNSENSAGRKVLKAMKTILKTVSTIAAEGIKWASEQVASGIRWIVDLISGRIDLSQVGAAGAEGLGFMGEILLPLGKALVHAWKVIVPAFIELLTVVWEKIVKWIKSPAVKGMLMKAAPWIAAAMFGPAVTRALLAAASVAIGKALIGGLKKAMGSSAVQKSSSNAVSKLVDSAKKASDKGGRSSDVVKQRKVVEESGKMAKAGRGWGVKDAAALGLKLLAIAAALAIGGVMMAGSIIAMKFILKSGGVNSVEDAAAPLLILTAMAVNAVPLMFALRLAAKVGSPGAIIKGGLAIGLAVGIVGLVGAGLAKLMNSVGTTAQLAAAGTIMLKMSLVFLATVPLIVAAAAFGAVLSTGYGLAIIPLMLMGFAVITTAVTGIAGVAMAVTATLAQLKIGPDFERKIAGFLGIMKSIQALTGTMVKLIDLMTPSIMEFLSGKVESMTDKLKSSTELLTKFIGEKGGKGGLMGLIETVINIVKSLESSPKIAESAQIFGSIMQATVGLMKIITPSDAFYEAGSGFIRQMSEGGKSFSQLAWDTGYHADVMRKAMMTALTGTEDGSGSGGMLAIVKSAARIRIPNTEAAAQVSKMLSALASIAQALLPDAQTVQSFKTVQKDSALWGLIEDSTEYIDTNTISNVISRTGSTLAALIPVIQKTMQAIITQITGIDVKKLKVFEVVGPLIGAISSIMNSITQGMQGSESTTRYDPQTGKQIEHISKQAPSLSKTFEAMLDGIPQLMNVSISLIEGIKVDKSSLKRLKSLKDIFSFISEIPKLVSLLQTGGKGGVTIDSNAVIGSVNSMKTIMGRLWSDSGQVGVDGPLGSLINSMSRISDLVGKRNVGALGKIGKTLASFFENAASTVSSLSGIGDDFGDTSSIEGLIKTAHNIGDLFEELASPEDGIPRIADQVNKISLQTLSSAATNMIGIAKEVDRMRTDGLAPAMAALSDMVKLQQQMDIALTSGLKTPLIDAKMKKLAKNVGLGGKATYTVRSKPVNITINMRVHISAEDMEQAIVMRATSTIRQNLNFLSDAVSKSDPTAVNAGGVEGVPNTPIGLETPTYLGGSAKE